MFAQLNDLLMKSFLEKIVFILLFACDVFALAVETMDEQVNSNNLMVLRLRIRNETGEPLYSTRVKFFVSGESVALDAGNYLWKVEAKNTVTDYASAGVGAGFNYLSVEELFGIW